MSFLLVVSTISRTTEVGQLFDSLCKQTYKNFRVVLVDQNTDARLDDVVRQYKNRISIHHTRSGKGVSKGRNRGLEFLNDSDFVAFPDDDCRYPADTLERVLEMFTKNPEWDGVTGRSVTLSGGDSNGRWHHEPGRVVASNVFNRATAFSIFARASKMDGIRFDESLGPGDTKANSLWGCGEDIDLVLQLIQRGYYIHFDPTLTIQHPEWSITGYTPAIYNKAKSYGRGMGRLLRKHGYPLHQVAYHLIRPIGGGVVALLKGRLPKARYHWSMFSGRLYGWSASLTSPELREPAPQYSPASGSTARVSYPPAQPAETAPAPR